MSSIPNEVLSTLCNDAYKYRGKFSHEALQLLFYSQTLSSAQLLSIFTEVDKTQPTLLYWCALLINSTLFTEIYPESTLNNFLYIKKIQSFNPYYFQKFIESFNPVLLKSICMSQHELLYSWAEGLKDLINYPGLKCCIQYLKFRLKADLFLRLEFVVNEEDLNLVLSLLQDFEKLYSVFKDFLKFFDKVFRFILKLVRKSLNDLTKKSICVNIINVLGKYQDGFGKRNLKVFENIEKKLGCGRMVKMNEIQIVNDVQICPGFDARSIRLEQYPVYQMEYKNFGVRVFKGFTEGQVRIAAKEYTIYNSEFDFRSVNEEIRVLTFLNQNSQVFTTFPKLYQVLNFQNRIILYMEDAGSNLMDVMTEYRRKGQLIDPNTIEVWMVQLIESLSWLSNCRIFHRNIKPHNILLSSDSKIKLIDFRFSTECDTIESSMLATVLNPIQGPEGYLAPELVEAISNGETVAKYKIGKADIYSLGLSLLQIFTLEKITGLNLPGNYSSILQKINKIKANDWVKNLLSKMLLEDRKERLSFCKCLELIPYGTNTSHF